jgi:hypothetical protein
MTEGDFAGNTAATLSNNSFSLYCWLLENLAGRQAGSRLFLLENSGNSPILQPCILR